MRNFRQSPFSLLLVVLVLMVGTASAAIHIDTFNVSDTNSDGIIGRVIDNTTFTDLRDGSGTSVALTSTSNGGVISGLLSDTTTDTYDESWRYGFCANTSNIPDNAIINSIMLHLYVGTLSDGLGTGYKGVLTDFSPTNKELFVAADYDRTSNIPYSTNYTVTTGSNNLTGNPAFISAINKTGYTCNYFRTDGDVFNYTTGGAWSPVWASNVGGGISVRDSGYAGIASDPYYEINWSDVEIATLVGDSLTEGLFTTYNGLHGYGGYILDDNSEWEVYVSGYSGEDSDDMISRYTADVSDRDATIVFYEVGNDITHGDSYETIVSKYISYDTMASANGTTVYFNTIPPRTGTYVFDTQNNSKRIDINTWLKCNFTPNHSNRYFVDLDNLISANSTALVDAYTYDGTHLTDEGYQAWGQGIDTAFPTTDTSTFCSSLIPAVSFTANATTGAAPLIVAFTDTSTNTPNGWDWYMWDNETKTSDDQNPEITFTLDGEYPIRLYANNTAGGSWANTTTITITPPYAITNLTNTTPTTSAITWTWEWDAPVETVLMIFQNGTFWTNSSNTTTSRTWTGLPSGTNMTFSSLTCYDAGRECNTTWVNRTALTAGDGPDCIPYTIAATPRPTSPTSFSNTSLGETGVNYATDIFSIIALFIVAGAVVMVIMLLKSLASGGTGGSAVATAIVALLVASVILIMGYLIMGALGGVQV